MQKVSYALMLVRNSPELTRKAIDAVLAQDIKVRLVIVDNDSDYSTKQVIRSYPQAWLLTNFSNMGVTKSWNAGLRNLFSAMGAESVLVIGNDTEVPPHYYRTLLETKEKFISGVGIAPSSQTYWSCGKQIPIVDVACKSPHPDFSAFVIRRECWMTIGEFDERMIYYAQDCDYHVRMHRAGIWAGAIACEFHHATSSTLRSMPLSERSAILEQADKDRAIFHEKYGCSIGTSDYDKLFA